MWWVITFPGAVLTFHEDAIGEAVCHDDVSLFFDCAEYLSFVVVIGPCLRYYPHWSIAFGFGYGTGLRCVVFVAN